MRVVVIGGGVVGLASAYELQKRCAEVTVLDKGQLGRAASWGNAGWIVPSLSGPVPEPGITLTAMGWLLKPDSPLYIKPRLSPDFVRWMWVFWRHCNPCDYHAGLDAMARLNEHTMELYDAWEAEGVPFEMHCSGLLFVFLTAKALDKSLAEFDHLRSYGYDVPRTLSGDEVRERAPILSDAVVGGLMVERDRHVEPFSLTRGLAERLMALGADLRTDTAVTGLVRHNGKVQAVRTEKGVVEGDVFLLAAGAWSEKLARLAGFRLLVESGKGYSITVRKPRTQLQIPLLLGEVKVGISPFDDSLRIAGTMELSGLSEDVNQRRLDAIQRSIQRYLRAWPAGEGEVTWAGMRPLTPDGLPAMGLAPAFSNLFIATGHSMLGVTLAPSTGKVMAELICDGRTETDVQPFAPARFNS
jgi:D-amino-acid dehydrogenase